MTPGFSIPTDNIYKFYALLGLALILSSVLAFVYVYDTNRARTLGWSEEIRLIEKKARADQADKERKELLETMVQIENENKKFYMKILSMSFGVGIGIGVLGLLAWQFSVQPRADRLVELQINSLELEIAIKEGQTKKDRPRYF
ncbi:hypothetical protein [Neptuniibacter caesariensis]|uniref:Uncharacterized protein n=1 Tax=Neptuniibacter caesariensis TaxID=207954 RepID=A0A7U8CAK7_NEPCE|nr:hypothetical protein [Neptuniibacter caesariensis]EAR62901.1 hypothetical protein MED92_07276 [Oceanospirillum sp. MED92] [Neptuniibacter caesariensis]